jgi:AmmeMemoRadiSam system protein B
MKILNKNKILFLCLLLIITIVIFYIASNRSTKERSKKINVVDLEERSVFFEAIQKFPKQKSQKKIIAGITPHHLLAADLIAESLSIILSSQPKTIILVGPNHDELGDSNMISSDYSWDTDIGKVEPNIKLLQQLEAAGFFKMNNEVIKKDHAIFNILPFIKNYSPDSQIVPILMSRNIDLEYAQKFSDYLLTDVKTDYIIVSSIDFSHYLSAEIAASKDEETLELIENFYLEKIFSLTNDNLDCPACLALSMIISDKRNGLGMQLIRNTNSGLLTNNYNAETTSYITSFFPLNEEKEIISAGKDIKNPKESELNFLFFGDLILDRHVKEKIDANGLDYLFEKIDKDFFNDYDIISANLEGAITNNGLHYDPIMEYDFAFNPELIKELKKYNFNFFNLANNHITDQGEQGINETRNNLDNLNINYVGCKDTKIGGCSSKVIELNNRKIGIIGLSMVYSDFDLLKVGETINGTSSSTDFVIANIHWGDEYAQQFNKEQQEVAHSLIDEGVDIIIGHHPHVVQGIEIYKNKPIFYSLGNFIFDQYFSSDAQKGLAVSLEFNNKDMYLTLYPFKSILSQVELMDESESSIFFEEIIERSELNDKFSKQVKNGYIYISLN